MATAKFGIVTTVDDAALAKLVKTLTSLPDISKLISQAWDAVAPKVEAATKRVQAVVEEGEKKVTAAKQQSTERVKQLLTEQVSAQEAAANRTKQIEANAARFTAESDKKTTTELVDHIFELQKKKTLALNASKAAALEGAKAEVAEQKKVIEGYDQELRVITKLSIQRKEVQKEGAGVKIGQMGTGREANEGSQKGGIGIGAIAGIGAAAEGLSMLVEKSKAVAEASHALAAGTGLTGNALKAEGEAAEEVGDKLGVSGDKAKISFGHIAGIAQAQGLKMNQDELNKLGEAAIAYEQATGRSADRMIRTEQGRAELMRNVALNTAKAQEAANDPAIRAQLVQEKLEEEVGKLANTMLTILGPALKFLTLPGVLPALAIGIGAVTIAMKAQSIMAKATAIGNAALSIATGVQTAASWLAAAATGAFSAALQTTGIPLLIIGIVALVAAIVLLIMHWKEVIEWIEKAAKTIMHAGGKLLEFLGITGKAEAATSKQTKALKDNKKSLEEIRQATEDAAKATADYTDTITKNQDEQLKSAKQGEDDSIHAMVDIQERLKTATGAQKVELEKSLAQWKEYGERQAVLQDRQDKETQDATDSLRKKDTEKKKKVPDKTAKDAYEQIKKDLTEKYDLQKEAAEEDTKNAVSLKDRLLVIQQAQDKELLTKTEQYNIDHATKKKSLAGMEHKIWQDGHAITLADQDKALKDSDVRNAEALDDLELQGVKENLTEKQIADKSYALKLAALSDRLALEQQFGRDTESTQKAIADLERTHMVEEAKQTEAIKKGLQAEAAARELTDMKSQLEELKSLRGNHAKEIAAQENAIALQEEDARYAKEQVDRKDDLANVAMGNSVKLSMEANHTGKMLAIAKQGADAQRKVQQEQAAYFLGPITQAYTKAFGIIDARIDHSLGLDKKKTNAVQELASNVVSSYIKMATQAVISGHVSELADEAAAGAKFVAAGATAIYKAFESMPFPLDLIAAAGSIAAVVGLAAEAKHIGGHAMGTSNSPGGMFWHGESGPELYIERPGSMVIPNHQINMGGGQDLTPLLRAVNRQSALMERNNDLTQGIHNNGKPGYGSAQGLFNLLRGQNQSQNVVNRRQIK